MIATENYIGQPFTPEGDRFASVFENNPLPMWVYDLETLRFLAVNEAAVRRYGYSRPEFLTMTINDLRPLEETDVPKLSGQPRPKIREWRGWRHQLKNGDVIEVELTIQGLRYEGHKAAFVIVNGIHGNSAAQEASSWGEDPFRIIFENSGAATILVDLDSGRITDANTAAASLTGYTPEILCSMQVEDIIVHPDDAGRSALFNAIVNASGKRIKSRLRLSGGDVRDADMDGREVSAGGKKLFYLVIGQTQAEPSQEVTPAVSDQEIHVLLDLSSQGYYRRTPDGQFTDVNEAFANMLGYTREEMLSANVGESIYLVAPRWESGDESYGPSPLREIYRLRKKDGREIWVEDRNRFVRDAEGRIKYREGFCTDVTDQRTTADKVGEEPVAYFRQSLENILLVRKSDHKIVEASRAAELASGYSREELIGKSAGDLFSAGAWESAVGLLDSANQESTVFEARLLRKSGSSFPAEVGLQRLGVDGEDCFVCISRDRSALKNAEETLKRSEAKYRSIFEKSPLGILFFDVNGVVVDCNESLAAIMASSQKSVIGLKLLELPSRELVGAVRKVLEGKLGVYEGEYRSFTSSKSIHVHTTFTAVTSPSGRPAGGMGIFEDITERDKAEDALRQSEMRYRMLYENSPVPYQLLDTSWKIVDVNLSWVELLGYGKLEVLGRDFVEFVVPEQASLLKEKLEAFKTSGVLGNLEVDVVAKGGRKITAALEGKTIRDSDGAVRQAQFMLYDVTDRKMAENALKESEQKFKSLAETASSSIFMYQGNKICYVNAACVALTGYSEQELLKMDFWEVVHPDFRELTKELGMARQRGEAVPNHFELKLRTKSGEGRWVDFTATTAQYKGNLAVLGTVYDVTERKVAKKKLEESEEQRRLLVDKSPDAIMILTGGQLVYVNPATVTMLRGDNHNQFTGRPLSEIVHQDSRGKIDSELDEIRKTLQPLELQREKFLRADGSTVEVDIVAAPITYLENPSIQVVAREATDRAENGDGQLQEALLNSAANAIAVSDIKGIISWTNPAFGKMTGYTSSETVGRNICDLDWPDRRDDDFLERLWDTVLSGNVWRDEAVVRRKDGKDLAVDLTITPVRDGAGSITHIVWAKQDNAMRKSLEDQLLRAKKLEGIGQLASGVLQDYNSTLGVILGYGELLKRKLGDQDPVRLSVDAILSAARRGADLTKQLLTFEREGVMSPRILDVNKAIETMQGMLHRVIGDELKLEFVPLKGLWNVRIDPVYLYEIIVNLASNARDAIRGESGTLEIKTSNVEVDESFARKHEGFTPGEYVMISFSDNGNGIDATIQDRIFEPFITTKQKERGAGLGLAAVYEMVKRNAGAITVRTAAEEGTTFCIYLPRFQGQDDNSKLKAVDAESLRSDRTVLVVEDQTDLLDLVRQNLEEYGYKVLTAAGPEEAIDICEDFPEEIDILLTDVMLPGINGRELSQRIATLKPQIKTIFVSGYNAEALIAEGVIDERVEFLQKPFTASELAGKVHGTLLR